MRKEKNKEYIVNTTTTGYIEADMLGHCMVIAEEMSAKQKSSQRPHRKEKSVSELLREGFVIEKHQRDLEEELEEASNGALRSLIVLKYKIKYIGVWLKIAMRKV